MSFSLAGPTITQSGTDTSLTGLAGIAGVTVFGSGSMKFYYLDAANLNLTVTGTLTYGDTLSSTECLIFGPNCANECLTITGTGVLTTGADYTEVSHINQSSRALLMQCLKVIPGASVQIRLNSSATWNIKGGRYEATGTTYLNGLGYAKNADIVGRPSSDGMYGRFSPWSTGFQIQAGCQFYGEGIGAVAGVTLTSPRLNKVNQYNFFAAGAVLNISSPYISDNFRAMYAGYNVEGFMTCDDSNLGVTTSCFAVPPALGTSYIRLYSNANIYTKTQAGASITDAVVFWRDRNDGTRRDITNRSVFYGLTADQVMVYAVNVSGYASLRMRILDFTTYNSTGAPASGDQRFTYRVNADGSTTVYAKAYSYLPASVYVDTAGNGTKLVNAVMQTDSSVTMSKSAANALAAASATVSTAGVGAVTISSSMTLDDLYDLMKAWGASEDIAHLEFPSASVMPMTNQGGVLTTAMAITLADGVTLSSGAKMTSLLTTAVVTLTGSAGVDCPYTDAAGVHVRITAPALVAGSRVQVYDVTVGAELYNGVLASTGLSLPAVWTADHVLRLRADSTDTLPIEVGGILGVTGATFLDVQRADTVYLAVGIDGATCTEFVDDDVHIQVDISDPDGVTSVQRLYAWAQHYYTTADGIAGPLFGAITAIDAANFLIDTTRADVQLDNVSGLPVKVVGGYLSRSDGSTVIAATSGSIQMDPGKAYIAPGSLVHADVRYVNGVQIKGTGVAGDTWGPV